MPAIKPNLRRTASSFALMIAIAGVSNGMAAAQILSPCTEDMAGEIATCEGDVTVIPFQSSDTVTELEFENLTTDIGARGFRFRQTGGGDVSFDTSAEPLSILLDPPAGPPDLVRNGFHVETDGAIIGTFAGTLSGQVEADYTASNNTRVIASYGALGLEAGTGIDLTLNGDIDVSRGTITQTATSRQDLWQERFAALRAETDAGDISINSTGNISIDGGVRNVTTTNTSEGTAGARAIQFTNGFSENHGIFAQGFGTLDLTHTGDITLTGGGANVSATTENNTADAQGAHAEQYAIYTPAFNTINGEVVEGLPEFEQVNLELTGDINVSGGELTVSATSMSTGEGQTPGMAVAQGNDFVFSGNAGGVVISAINFDVDIDGAVSVTGGNTSVSAVASAGGSGETAGTVFADSVGQTAFGVSVGSDFEGTGSLSINGPVSVRGGDATVSVVGAGPGVTGTLYSDIDDRQQNSGVTARAGGAVGVSYGSAGEANLLLTSPIDVRGGDTFAELDGRDYGGFVSGGNGTALSVFHLDETPISYAQNTLLTSRGGDADAVVTGTGLDVSLFGGSGLGADYFSGALAQFTQNADIEVRGGDISYSIADGNEEIEVRGGFAQGMQVILNGSDAGTAFNLNGTINAIGGDASGTGDVEFALGGDSLGAFLISGGGGSPTYNVNGTINAIAGSGPTGRGDARGLNMLDSGTLNVFGTINAEGGESSVEGFGRGFSGAIGIAASDRSLRFNDTPGIIINVDGGRVQANGDGAAGIGTSGRLVDINIINGGTVEAIGDRTDGVIVFGEFDSPTETIIPAVANVFVDADSSLSSSAGAAISDTEQLERVTFTNGERFVEILDSPNQVTVEIAGTVTGGSGVAVDLLTGEDTFIGRSTGIINGDVLLGDDADTVITEDGVTINGILDTGAGADIVELANGTIADSITLGDGDDVLLLSELSNTLAISGGAGNDAGLFTSEEGDDLSFDLGNFALLDFETFAQDGPGKLTVTSNSADVFGAYELRGGTAQIETDLSGVNVTTFASTDLILGGDIGGLDLSGTVSTLGDPTAQAFVDGDIIFRAGSLYNARFLPDGSSDRISASGGITIEGGEVNAMAAAGTYIGGDSFTILSGDGGVTGQFDGLTTDSTAFLDISLEYIGNDVVIQLAPTADFTMVAGTTNQMGSATGLLDFQTLEGSDERVIVSEFSFLMEGEALDALDATSGEIHATALQAGLELADFLPDTLEQRAFTRTPSAGFSFWAGAQTDTGGLDGDGNAASTDTELTAFMAGVDWGSADGTLQFGAAIAQADETVESSARRSEAGRDGTHLGAYGRYGASPRGLNAFGAVSISNGDMDTTRWIQFGNVDRVARATYDFETTSLKSSVRYGFGNEDSNWSYGPVGELSYISVDQGNITETGAQSLNLQGGAQSESDTSLAFGGFANWQSDDTSFDASVVYDFAEGDPVGRSLALEGASSTSFAVFGPDAGSGRFKVNAGADWRITEQLSVGFGYQGQFGDSTDNHGAVLTLTLKR